MIFEHQAPQLTGAELIRPWAASAEEATALERRLEAVAQAILAANRRMNLTGDEEPRLFRERHVEDALWAARCIEKSIGRPTTGERVLDVGSGGGIPGLFWSILWPAARVDLLEVRRKKARFLKDAIEKLALGNAGVLEGRAEELGREPSLREQYGLVTARALAPLPTLLELTLPFVRVGGRLAAIKAAPLEAELAAAENALHQLGTAADAPNLLPYTRSDGKACVVCLIHKTSPTPPAYPRRAGLPERRPL